MHCIHNFYLNICMKKFIAFQQEWLFIALCCKHLLSAFRLSDLVQFSLAIRQGYVSEEFGIQE